MESNQVLLCKVCEKKISKYTCPRCHLLYCSLACYQAPAHVKCSEDFYRENVEEELHQGNASPEEKRAIMEILHRFEEECMEDDEALTAETDAEKLTARLQGVNLDGDPQKIWEHLTAEERENFMKLIKENKVGDLVTAWVPWWTYKKDAEPLIQDATKPSPVADISEYCFPDIKTTFVAFNKLSKSPPAEVLKFNTLNILLAYTYIALRYNGEHVHMAIQCAEDLVSLSDVLLKSENCSSVSEAITEVYQSLKKLDDLYISMEFFVQAVDSLTLIINGPESSPSNDYLLMAISDILDIIINARKDLKREKDSTEGCKQLFLMKKKLEYYGSWIFSHGCEELNNLSDEIILHKVNLSTKAAPLIKKAKESSESANSAKAKKSVKPKIIEIP